MHTEVKTFRRMLKCDERFVLASGERPAFKVNSSSMIRFETVLHALLQKMGLGYNDCLPLFYHLDM